MTEIKKYIENSDKWEPFYGGHYLKVNNDRGTVSVDKTFTEVYIWSGLGMEQDYAYQLSIKSLKHFKRVEELFLR